MIIPATIARKDNIISPAIIVNDNSLNYPRVDEWVPTPDDIIFRTCKTAFIVPVTDFYKLDNKEKEYLNYFILTSKRCYVSDLMRTHTSHYLNYFEKFFDQDKELFMIYCKIKPLIDHEPNYTKENFLYDLKRYMLSPTMLWKIKQMDEYNYYINLTYRNNNQAICYTNRHAKLLMRISLLMNMIIPLMTHFMYMRSMPQDDEFILSICDMLLDIPIYSDVDLYNKLYETSSTNVNTSYKRDTGLWDQQDIRSRNVTTHAISCIENILLHLLPKYTYNDNVINLNFGSINNSNGYQVTNITWEFCFTPLSSSNRDEDNNSEFDKYEAMLIKSDWLVLSTDKSLHCRNTVSKPF